MRGGSWERGVPSSELVALSINGTRAHLALGGSFNYYPFDTA